MNFALFLLILLVVTGAVWLLDIAVLRKGRSAEAKQPWWVEYSISFFPVKGSPICTLGRLAAESSPNPCEASTLAPPMPSRPVDDPSRIARFPSPSARARTSRSFGSNPRQNTLTNGLSR